NYSGLEVASYLEYALRQSQRVGLYIHYSETHDNTRLAARGRAWSLLRNRLCALTSVSGGFGFTCGVEWLAEERVNVHSSRGLAWNSEPNVVSELAKLNELLRSHPCFFDGATLTRITAPDSSVYALLRESADKAERVLVVVNTDEEKPQLARFDPSLFCAGDVQPASFDPKLICDLLGEKLTMLPRGLDGSVVFEVPRSAALCLSLCLPTASAPGSRPDASGRCEPLAKFSVSPLPPLFYRRARAQAA